MSLNGRQVSGRGVILAIILVVALLYIGSAAAYGRAFSIVLFGIATTVLAITGLVLLFKLIIALIFRNTNKDS